MRRACASSMRPSSSLPFAPRPASARAIAGLPSTCWASTKAFTGCCSRSAWLLSDLITRKPAATVLLWLTVLGTILALPNLALVLRVDLLTEQLFGVGARGIALIDAAATSPLVHLSLIPLLTLIAVYAPSGHRATWFALMASLMNLALTAGPLGTKYLNLMLPVDRGDYTNLPMLLIAAIVISFVLPLSAILMLGRRVR